MRQKNILISILILVVVAGGLLAWYFLSEEPTNSNMNAINDSITKLTVIRPEANTVWIINGDFNPAVVTVAVGEKVVWVNKDDIRRQVAADPHPTSESLPDMVSGELLLDETFAYTFSEPGEWYYHDYLNPIKKGKIVVE